VGLACVLAEDNPPPPPERLRLTVDDATADRLRANADARDLSLQEFVRRLLAAATRHIDDLLP
jgi:hypothetical protein